MGNKAIVKSVVPGSIADEIGLEKGDKIVKVNNTEFTDILDFKFLVSDDYYTLEIETAQGTQEIERTAYLAYVRSSLTEEQYKIYRPASQISPKIVND